MEEVVILAGVRTPIGAFGGSLRSVPVYELGALVLNEAVKKAGLDPGQVDEVIVGQAYQNGECANAGRFSVLAAGWPESIPAVTIDSRCCSGVDSVLFGVMKIQTGNAQVVVAGGMDSMSRAELYLPGEIRWGLGGRVDQKWGFMPRGHGALPMWGVPFFDRIQRARVMSQPVERYGELNSMMSWAEAAARAENVTREEADAWSLRSHQRACAAMKEGRFAGEIVPVPLRPVKGEPLLFREDETPRADTTLDKLAGLKPVYENGICTAGNSSSENDGAAAVVLASKSFAREMGLKPLAGFVAGGNAACDPTLTYPAVASAVNKALGRAHITLADIELLEIQEAFAAQVLADARLLGLTREECEQKVNVNGSGISLGHPIGATGTMRMVTLVHEMARRQTSFGLETICGGGGQGVALILRTIW
ncbi:MAG: thiolase family protein [Syntrophobacteraceae bacterium]|nr:thiolase family protein [Syntrophobacteraceae bacterium]